MIRRSVPPTGTGEKPDPRGSIRWHHIASSPAATQLSLGDLGDRGTWEVTAQSPGPKGNILGDAFLFPFFSFRFDLFNVEI